MRNTARTNNAQVVEFWSCLLTFFCAVFRADGQGVQRCGLRDRHRRQGESAKLVGIGTCVAFCRQGRHWWTKEPKREPPHKSAHAHANISHARHTCTCIFFAACKWFVRSSVHTKSIQICLFHFLCSHVRKHFLGTILKRLNMAERMLPLAIVTHHASQ